MQISDKYGRLTLKSFEWRQCGRKRRKYWTCLCDCGNTAVVRGDQFRDTVSCGCRKREHIIAFKFRHGYSTTPEHKAWRAMIARCENPRHSSFPDYGGRGITVCDRWRNSFEAFLADMGARPSDLYTLERIDNNSGYRPDNCIWATRKQQQRNRRPTRFVEVDGERMSLPDAAERYGINYKLAYGRLRKGWAAARALGVAC